MKLGLYGINIGSCVDPEVAAAAARDAEEAGFESVWTAEHVVLPEPRTPESPIPASTPLLDPATALAHIAAHTKRIKLATGIIILPQRNPVVLAKQVATLDVLSGGRVDLGVGVGWLREEFAALGVPWERRGRRTDEYIEAMRTLWTQPVASYEGETVRFQNVVCDPRPVQPGGVPITIGGHTMAAARRAGRHGDGFFPNAYGRNWHELIAEMRRSAEEAGRDPSKIAIMGGVPPELETVQKLAERGVSRVNILVNDPDVASSRRTMEKISREVISRM